MKSENKKGKREPRERILQAGMDEFAERGYAGARIESIARKAGVNAALINYHFKGKENLYRIILNSVFGDFERETLLERVKNFSLEPPQKLYIAVCYIVNRFLKMRDPRVYRIILRELADGNRFLKGMARDLIIPRRREILKNIITEGIMRGFFAAEYPVYLVYTIFAFLQNLVLMEHMVEGTDYHETLYGEGSRESIKDFMVKFIFRELAPENQGPALPAIPDELLEMVDELAAVE